MGLAETALAAPAEADAEVVEVDLAARKRPVDTLRLIIVCVSMVVGISTLWVLGVVFGGLSVGIVGGRGTPI